MPDRASRLAALLCSGVVVAFGMAFIAGPLMAFLAGEPAEGARQLIVITWASVIAVGAILTWWIVQPAVIEEDQK